MASSETFSTTVAAHGNNTGIVVPPDVIDRLGGGKRPPVLVDINGYAYRTTVGVMGGEHLISISAAIRKETGLTGGDPITVTLRLAETPREVAIPEEFAAALAADTEAAAFFDALPNSLQRFHADNITGATSQETRQRRIDKAIAAFRRASRGSPAQSSPRSRKETLLPETGRYVTGVSRPLCGPRAG